MPKNNRKNNPTSAKHVSQMVPKWTPKSTQNLTKSHPSRLGCPMAPFGIKKWSREGGTPLKIDKKTSQRVSKKLWKWRSYHVVLPRSVLRALKIARFLFEPELQENRTELPKSHNHNHRHGPETKKKWPAFPPGTLPHLGCTPDSWLRDDDQDKINF